MNSSKFIDVIGQEKKEKFTQCFLNPEIEGRIISVNKKFIAMSWYNSGEIVVLNSSLPSQIKKEHTYIKIENGKILDLEFSPFNKNILATAHDNSSIAIWKLSEEGIIKNYLEDKKIYNFNNSKVNFISFNPVAQDVICSSVCPKEIHILNIKNGAILNPFKTDGNPTTISWNPNGSLIGVSTSNRYMNIFDPRNEKKIINHQINEKHKQPKFVWLDNSFYVTIGWNKNEEKMLKLWDIRKIKEDISNEGEITSLQIDNYSKVTTPYVDRESKLIYTIGKGDNYIYVYDYSEGIFKKGNEFNLNNNSNCAILFNRECLDYQNLEIDRFAIYNNNHEIKYVSFYIPNKNNNSEFYEDFYPPIECGESALSCEQWKQGENSEPIKKKINTILNENDKKEIILEKDVKQKINLEYIPKEELKLNINKDKDINDEKLNQKKE